MKLHTVRQRPVIFRLQTLLDQSLAVSRAVLDNTLEDVEPLPESTYEFISGQLKEIDQILRLSAHAVPEMPFTSRFSCDDQKNC
ncbi:hypothetical protein [uncultured Mediterranean phage uvMED]|nr:hypothetical protein [uncultured Mediterranean phage uvMED]